MLLTVIREKKNWKGIEITARPTVRVCKDKFTFAGKYVKFVKYGLEKLNNAFLTHHKFQRKKGPSVKSA